MLWVAKSDLLKIRLPEIAAALRSLTWWQVLIALTLTAMNYLGLAINDVLGVRYLHRQVPLRRVLATSFVAYNLTFNFGSLLGGAPVRYRLYTRCQLTIREVTALIIFCVATKWLGFFLVGGLAYVIAPLPFPDGVGVQASPFALRSLGATLLAIPAIFLALCTSKRREVRVRGLTWTLPKASMAVCQCLVSAWEWILVAAIVYVLLPNTEDGVSFGVVLRIYLAAAVVGLMTHIPGGLGVTEAVFIGFLSPELPASLVLARLLVFRALYYLIPLVPALTLLLSYEVSLRFRRLRT